MPDETTLSDEAVEVQIHNETENTENTDDNAGSDSPDQPKKRRRRRRRRGRAGGAVGVSETGDAPNEGGARSSSPLGREAPANRPKAGPSQADSRLDADQIKRIFADTSFAELGLRNSVLKGVADQGFTAPTHIQSRMIPLVLEGKDVLGQSRTGTGKTAAFGLPLFHLAKRDLPFQSIVLVPTRELAIQIAGELASFGKHTPIRVLAVYGGEALIKQQEKLRRGPEIIVATPGRLIDFLERGDMNLDHVRFVVLDEVDRMLDIGFRDDIRKILGRVRTEHQTILVSATIDRDIEKLAAQYMTDPVRIDSGAGALTVELVEQHYLSIQRWDKKRLLVHLLIHEEPALTLVFCATKRMVDDLARHLDSKNISVRAIHGDMPQRKRNSVMKHFRSGAMGVVVASDVAARGLDVDGISHVVNYDIPQDPEIYVHRIGRTARAGQRGVAWTFVTPEEGPLLTAVEKLANVEIAELEYPTFVPGPVPESVRRRMERKKADQQAPTEKISRKVAASPPPTALRQDSARFPGGLAPTRLPPKQLRGRVQTRRSMKQQPTLEPPKTDET